MSVTATRGEISPTVSYLCLCRRPRPYLDGLDDLDCRAGLLMACVPLARPYSSASPQTWPACLLVLRAPASQLCAGLCPVHASGREPPSPDRAYLFFAAARAVEQIGRASCR